MGGTGTVVGGTGAVVGGTGTVVGGTGTVVGGTGTVVGGTGTVVGSVFVKLATVPSSRQRAFISSMIKGLSSTTKQTLEAAVLCGADMFKICSYVYDKTSAVFRYFLTQIQSQLQVRSGVGRRYRLSCVRGLLGMQGLIDGSFNSTSYLTPTHPTSTNHQVLQLAFPPFQTLT